MNATLPISFYSDMLEAAEDLRDTVGTECAGYEMFGKPVPANLEALYTEAKEQADRALNSYRDAVAREMLATAARWDAMSDEEFGEMLEAAQEMVGDISAQYGSEVALCGDAWPGAAIQLDEARAELAHMESYATRRFPEPTAEEIAADPELTELYDDIPF